MNVEVEGEVCGKVAVVTMLVYIFFLFNLDLFSCFHDLF